MYAWKVRYRKLTQEEREQGIIFASQLNHDGEIGCRHTAKDYETVARLKDVKFFKRMARDFGFNVTEIRWS